MAIRKDCKVIGIIVLLFFLFSCAQKRPKPSGVAAPLEKKEEKIITYEFEDIPVPKEMKFVPERSCLVEYANMKGGMMYLEGRVDALSLFNFFYSALQQNGWNLIGYFRFKPYVLIMDKPDRECVIRIEDSGWNTKTEILVVPKGIELNQPTQ